MPLPRSGPPSPGQPLQVGATEGRANLGVLTRVLSTASVSADAPRLSGSAARTGRANDANASEAASANAAASPRNAEFLPHLAERRDGLVEVGGFVGS